ncbi:hypothetical protein [Mesorhizobium sp. M0854]|uniref:hypothetical protein n=1 Tax=unclassified Mesorhizobium TaxID=325217 RepID=UPI003334E653
MAAHNQRNAQLIQADDSLKARFALLVSILGISTATAFTPIIEMPELGDSTKAATSL